MIAWVFFRSETIIDGFNYLKILFFDFNFYPVDHRRPIVYIVIFILVEWFIRGNIRLDKKILFKNKNLELLFRLILLILIINHINPIADTEFIYFQF
jgi:hypothetical protein